MNTATVLIETRARYNNDIETETETETETAGLQLDLQSDRNRIIELVSRYDI